MPNVNFQFRGLIAPVFTPFNNDESLNISIIPQYAKFLASKNINGILVNGTTGEGTSLSLDERKNVAETWVTAVKETKQHLMVQVGGAALKDVKELAAHAEKIGVDSILCLPELYFKPCNIEELTDYLYTVGASAPKTPLLYYHIPMLSSVNINMVKFLESVGEKVPTFCGIKFTSNDLAEGCQAAAANSRLEVFLGSDVLMSAGCTLGMDSFIMTSLNFIPEPALELLKFGKGDRDLKSARKNQEFISKIVKEVTQYGSWVETMKVAMNLTTNLSMGPPRAPLKVLTKENIETMAKGLTEAGLKVNKIPALKMS
ncbi:N-acetylneuraminate lyase-like isoform X2 [Phymastichus coffea]|uniref:N-acetylneuraminate lyase-like isoform X2 n=1 Tax=Phymastichus coffea TaxID=108790 RepID=UPI00273C7DB0|nr:N-acetylneuraminate lyase-like isoform X2 [Phymastichus coffea]